MPSLPGSHCAFKLPDKIIKIIGEMSEHGLQASTANKLNWIDLPNQYWYHSAGPPAQTFHLDCDSTTPTIPFRSVERYRVAFL